MKTITTMNLKAQTIYIETLNELLYAINYCSARDHDEEELQQEKDKFAVEFFKWVKSNFYEFYDDDNFFEFKGYQRKILKGKAFQIYELLDIYKKELANHITTKEKV